METVSLFTTLAFQQLAPWSLVHIEYGQIVDELELPA
jgi:hypothetical protein